MLNKSASKEELTSYLYSKLNQAKVNLQKRMRARTLLSEVDKGSLKDFHKIIQISKDRVDNVKCGKSLNHELNLSDTKYKSLASDLCKKSMYFARDLKKDRERLKLNLNKNEHKEILSLFKIIKDNNDLKKRKIKREDAKQSLQLTNNCIHNNIRFTKNSIDSSTVNNDEKKTENNSNNNDVMQVIVNRTMYKSLSQDNLLKAKNYMKEIMELEHSQFNETIHEYLDMTKQIKESSIKENHTHTNSISNSYREKIKEEDKLGFSASIAKCISFTNGLKMLNYQRAVIPEIQPKFKEKKEDFDIKRMIKYTSMGEFPCLSPTNNNNIKNNSNCINNSNINNDSIEESSTDPEKNEIETLKSNLYDVNNSRDISNNVDMVKQELAFDRKVRDTFKSRGEAIDEYINKPHLPSLNEYSTKVKKIITQTQMSRHKASMKKPKEISNSTGTDKSKFFDSMFQIFQRKQNAWITEEFKDNQNKKLIRSTDKRNRAFLSKIEQGDRSPIRFCDEYSIRDGKANYCNKVISHAFGKHLYSKEEMSRFIEEYSLKYQEDEENNKKEIELKWKENQLIAEIVRKTQKMHCVFSNEDNKIEEKEENDTDLKSIYLKEKPSIKTSYSHDHHFKEYLYFKQFVENKEKQKNKVGYHSKFIDSLLKEY